jgi:hypothetical protein
MKYQTAVHRSEEKNPRDIDCDTIGRKLRKAFQTWTTQTQDDVDSSGNEIVQIVE